MSVKMIAAIGKNRELGKNNQLIWRFKEDMEHFKSVTMGTSVIMGRKTFESLPKALPGRKNIVISTNPDFDPPGATRANSIEQALNLAEGDVFIIGGATVYQAFLPLAHEIYLTEIDAVCPDADTFFPDFDKTKYERISLDSKQINGISVHFVVYKKK